MFLGLYFGVFDESGGNISLESCVREQCICFYVTATLNVLLCGTWPFIKHIF
ncbi:hypothetical protein HNQ69_001086 [Bartonella callosciuri]|uniref:Uncharacterized protein n=1 Tax=Bartonella callosciuri TaxID=686223 RepID=A0A840NVK4_9HYPH|nr:hypothetical protein [Bartonella callosciuri]